MKKKTVILDNEEGLHARPAAKFVQKANKYESEIEIEFKGNIVNGKSIIGIMSLGAFPGEKISIIASGSDENKAVEELINFLKDGFKEI
ncbi:MAG: HPr family phosphocarrier protein [Tissierella sp.]|uniref:HPr family phosphocarrier protein n=1 Tax=Tissierella sp. TaxID=41274 RepID=UPI003F96A12B